MCLLSGFLDTAQLLCMLPLIIGVGGLCALYPDSPDSWNLWGQQLKIRSQHYHSEQVLLLEGVWEYIFVLFPQMSCGWKAINFNLTNQNESVGFIWE